MTDRTVPAASADMASPRSDRDPPTLHAQSERRPRRAQAGDDDVFLGLLGGFALTQDGETVSVAPSAQRVLAFLALQERPVHRLYVAGHLWPASSEQHANASLRTALWRLHRYGCQVVSSQADHLALDGRVTVDVTEVVALAREILATSSSPSSKAVMRLCRAGDLLPDCYEDWLLIERERFRQLRLRALEAACSRLTACGRLTDALEAGLTAVAVEPLRESAHCAVITVHLAEGNRSEALRQYALFRALLDERLGIEPSRQIRELVASASVA